MTTQLHLFEDELIPPGFSYIAGFISPTEEKDILQIIHKLEFRSFEMYGVEAKRKIIHYGLNYDFLSRSVSETIQIPSWLLELKQRAETLLEQEISEALVTHYPVSSGIGWHHDAPAFESLLGISLKGNCRLQMRKGEIRNWMKYEQSLAPRSAYVIKEEARWLWQHHIPPVKEERYSLTFRTMKLRPE